ncbi:MAG: hypothetical protein IT198_09060 [Acidimicrobiia bacterium]|nr:hypothetical protein [Acidimicrobiia bacterium]
MRSAARVEGRVRHLAMVALAAAACVVIVSCSEQAATSGRIDETTTTTGPAAPFIPPAFLEGTSSDVFSFSDMIKGGLADLATVSSPEELALIATGAGAMDYLGLYEDVKKASYSVGYRVQGELVASVPGAVAFSIVHEPGRVKNTVAADDAVATMVIEDASAVTTCAKVGTWMCEPAEKGVHAYGAETLLLLLGLVAETPGAFDIETSMTEVIGVPVKCLTATPVGSASAAGITSPIEVCVTGEGIPLRVMVPTLTLEGVWYQPHVDPAEFELPA